MSGAYQDNNIVVAYTSERGEAQFGSDVVWGTHSGFRQDPGGTPFQINGHYTGGGDTRYLYYDGHPGYDFSTGGQNLPVYAAQSGTAHRGDLGLGEIYVDHGNGYTTHYLHLLVDGELVADNTPVDTTTQLGKAGGTGGFPVHLHFEVRYHGVPVDPYGWKGVGADPYTAMTNISLWSDTADQLVFVDIGPQAVDTPFQVTITARDRYGNIKTDFNSEVTLASSGAGAVNPISTHLTGGTATVTVTLSNPGTTSLTANGGGLSGKSKIFTVQGGNCQANITGRVIDLNNEAVTGATVSLYNNLALIDTVTTDLSGNYQFSHQPCGTYVLIFNKETDTQKSTTTTIYSNNQCAYLKTQLHLNAGTYGTPVILIPGILGSSQGYSRYPKLGEPQNKDKLTIHDPGRATGFRDLEDKLKEQGFTIFNCPWDWRLSPASAAEEYLKPKIEEALLKSTTGKVHIVAHSMGGLVARSLIQSSQELADKIGKFAMVGTPNLGSAHPYYIWEGGNPKMLDDIHDPGFFEVAPSFYERSLECLWEQTYGNKDWDALSYKKIKDFIQEKGPSLRDLMFTQKFLKNYSAENGVSLKNASPALTKLNSDPNRFRMSPDGVDNTIKTGLFLGKNSKQSDILPSHLKTQ